MPARLRLVQSGLDPEQLPLHGTHLIEASAGTGKTYTIATLFVRLIVERGLGVDQILVVTFTEAAAAELRERIRRRLRMTLVQAETSGRSDVEQQRLRLALNAFDEASISTIHGFCHRVLKDSAFETGTPFDLEVLTDESDLIDEIVRDLWAKVLYTADPMFVAYLHEHGITPSRLVQTARAAIHPDVPILPSQVEVDQHPDMAPFLAAFATVRRQWSQHREHALKLLQTTPGLHARRYARDHIPSWFDAMDAYLQDEEPSSILGFGQLVKLGTKSLVQNTKKGLAPPRHAVFEAIQTLIEAREPVISNYELRHLQLRRIVAQTIRRELPQRKRRVDALSFDDLLRSVDAALTHTRTGSTLAMSLRRRLQAALIDEFQDTDPIQYRIFETLYAKTELPLYLIGDPKQAIYGFRGADVFAYLRAANAIPARCRHSMDTNWRSDPALLDAIARLFVGPSPFLMPEIEFIPVSARPGADGGVWYRNQALPAFELWVQPCTTDNRRADRKQVIRTDWADATIPTQVATDIAAMLAARPTLGSAQHPRPVVAGDIAVLVRRHAQAQRVQAALRAQGVPAVVYGDASVFETHEAIEVHRTLAAILEPNQTSLIKSALATDLLGISARELDSMDEDDTAWSRWIDRFRHWHATWLHRGFIQMFRSLLTDARVSERILCLRDGERRMTNVLHLAELLHTTAIREHLGPAGLLRWLDNARHGDQTDLDAAKLRLESDSQAVQIVTIHHSKGLEYPIVYCPFAWGPDELRAADEDNLRFHDPQDHNRLKLDLSLKPSKRAERTAIPNIAQARRESESETLRLLYVALTRARHRCIVHWGPYEQSHRSALAFLLFGVALAPDEPDPFTRQHAVISRLPRLSHAEQLEHLEHRGQDAWHVVDLGTSIPAHRWTPAPAASRPTSPRLRARRVLRQPDPNVRVSSFTELSQSKRVQQDDWLGKDYDHSISNARDLVVPTEPSQPPDSTPVRLADFPRGPKVGNFFHELLEHLDFQAPWNESRPRLERLLKTYSIDAETWLEPLERSFDAILDKPLTDDPHVCLRNVPTSHRLNEFGFVLPVGQTHWTLTRDALADAFASVPDGLPPSYPHALRRLGFQPLRGFLKGFIDLVFRIDHRWYLADYKSNTLGDQVSNYDRTTLAEVMVQDHYILQSHLYALALMRFLEQRIPGYDHDRDFGGSLYLFLRGMTEPNTKNAGIYFDPIPKARLDAIANALRGPT